MTMIQVQALLVYLGYDPGPVDGVMGPKTRAAVYDFQKEYGDLKVDGLPGEETQKALRKAVGNGWQRPKKETVTPDVGQTTGGDWWPEIKYFRRNEPGIACPCGRCGGFPVEPTERLMRTANKVREHFGREMIPTSTVRCQAHNDELPGSAKNSRHLSGRAMDFVIDGVPVSKILSYVKSLPGVHYTYNMAGTYAVHMDVD